MSIVVDVRDAQRIVFGALTAFHADKVIAVSPTIKKTEPYGLEVVVGIEVPFAVCCDAGIFSLHGREV